MAESTLKTLKNKQMPSLSSHSSGWKATRKPATVRVYCAIHTLLNWLSHLFVARDSQKEAALFCHLSPHSEPTIPRRLCMILNKKWILGLIYNTIKVGYDRLTNYVKVGKYGYVSQLDKYVYSC